MLRTIKKLLGIVVLGLFLITPSQADDIRDFQIEGMSIGDSALDYFTEKEINDLMQFGFKKSKEYAYINLREEKLDNFDKVLILFKSEDVKFIIHSISGRIFFDKNIRACHKKQKELVNEFSELFEKISVKDDQGTYSYSGDDSGKSKVTTINFQLNDGGVAHVGCYKFSKEYLEKNNYGSAQAILSMSISSSEYNDFQKYRAF